MAGKFLHNVSPLSSPKIGHFFTRNRGRRAHFGHGAVPQRSASAGGERGDDGDLPSPATLFRITKPSACVYISGGSGIQCKFNLIPRVFRTLGRVQI